MNNCTQINVYKTHNRVTNMQTQIISLSTDNTRGNKKPFPQIMVINNNGRKTWQHGNVIISAADHKLERYRLSILWSYKSVVKWQILTVLTIQLSRGTP